MLAAILGNATYRLADISTAAQAYATAQINAGSVSGATVSNGGSGYFTPPQVTITGGGGTVASATATINGGAVTAIVIQNGGSGYSSPPAIQIDPPFAGTNTVAVMPLPVVRLDCA